jgi:TP901 family phage tail tape measure protein
LAERELAILIKARDLASKTIRGVGKEVDSLSTKVGRGARETASNLGKLSIAGLGLATVLTVGTVHAAGDFEAQLQTINTVAQRTPEALAEIGDGIRQLARDTGASLDELTQGYYDLVSAGIDASQAQKVLAASNTLAIGGLATAAEGVDLITTALNSYGVAAEEQGAMSERFADVFAKAIERGKVTAAELAASFANIGPLAASNGIEIEELAAAYATLTAKGIPAAEASTMMSSGLIALTRRTGDLEKLEKATGKSYLAIAGRKGLAVALEELRKDADKAGVPLIDLLGRQEALQLAINTTGDSFDDYNRNLEAMSDANGTAARQMSERQQGLNYQVARLKALALDAGITIGSKLIPKLLPLGERALAFLTGHEDDIERFGDSLAGAFDKALQFGERIPWEAIGSGLKTAAEWAGKLMDVFLGLPPEVQTTIIALAALNKLSGGAVSGIVSELGKGLIKGVLGINAGIVNVNARAVTGAGAGMAGGTAGGGGRLSSVASAVGKVFIVGAAAGIFAELLGNRLEQADANRAAGGATEKQATVYVEGANIEDLKNNLKGLRERQAYLTNNLTPEAIAYQLDMDGVKTTTERVIATLQGQITTLEAAAATQRNIGNERLEAIRNPIEKTQSTATSLLASSERAEAIATQKADQVRQQIAAGDTRTELAISGAKNRAIQDSASERAYIQRSGAAAAAASDRAASAIKNKRISTNVNITTVAQFDYRGTIKKSKSYTKIGLRPV